jgi:hypothetical protein
MATSKAKWMRDRAGLVTRAAESDVGTLTESFQVYSPREDKVIDEYKTIAACHTEISRYLMPSYRDQIVIRKLTRKVVKVETLLPDAKNKAKWAKQDKARAEQQRRYKEQGLNRWGHKTTK